MTARAVMKIRAESNLAEPMFSEEPLSQTSPNVILLELVPLLENVGIDSTIGIDSLSRLLTFNPTNTITHYLNSVQNLLNVSGPKFPRKC